MKKIVENNVLRKIIIIPVIVFILLTFAMPTVSRADDGNWGTSLLGWVLDLLTSLPIFLTDGINAILNSFADQNLDFFIVMNDYGEIIDWINEGNGAENGLPEKKVVASKEIGNKLVSDEKNYAILKAAITPVEIFSNKVALLDANYFNSELTGNKNSEQSNYDEEK